MSLWGIKTDAECRAKIDELLGRRTAHYGTVRREKSMAQLDRLTQDPGVMGGSPASGGRA